MLICAETLSHLSTRSMRPARAAFCATVFVLFAVGLAAAADPSGAVNSNASTIAFTPAVVTLNNPTDTRWLMPPAASTQVTVNFTVYDSRGDVTTPTEDHPLHVHVYGAPDGVITPLDSTLTSTSSVTYTYNGQAFPNNMELAAWMDDPATGGASLGTTLFIPGNRPACSYGTASYDLNVTSNAPKEIQVKAVVGADDPKSSDFKTFTIDTGSLGVIVTKSNLFLGDKVHGPGAKGQKFYDSSGFVFTGNYYLAPVSVQLTDGTFIQTNPIIILAIDGVHCAKGYKNCVQPGRPELHYLGVGFDRNSTGTGDLFNSPSENAFLELKDGQNGTDINGGYILTSSGMTVGITAENSAGFNTITLDPNTTVPGDWNPVPGCYAFPGLTGSPQFCGNLLLDVGIAEMFMDLPSNERPAGSYGSNNRVPDGVEMKIVAGAPHSQPAMVYHYNAVQPPQQPSGPAPTYSQWINDSHIFVNTGRRPLMNFDYFYSGRCGEVGFRSN